MATGLCSVTSVTDLRYRMDPGAAPVASWVEQCLAPTAVPVVALRDYLRMVPDLIPAWVPRRCVPLGTDGFDRSDTRAALRRIFKVDRHHIALTAGEFAPSRVEEAIAR